jgi:hypothetical protein
MSARISREVAVINGFSYLKKCLERKKDINTTTHTEISLVSSWLEGLM